MITSLRSDSIDLAIGLTEGWVAGLLTAAGQKEKGYSIVGSWVQNPLRWAIVTGRTRDEIETVHDLRLHRNVGVSRMGSGSHVMAYVLALQEGWLKPETAQEVQALNVVPLGPFDKLRDGVIGVEDEPAKADFFMWEHFTTKPFFHLGFTPLKKIGELYTPWPSWHIAASTSTFPNPETDERLAKIFEAFDKGVKQFNDDPEIAVRMLGTGELNCHYSEEDAREWLKSVEFSKTTRGVDEGVMTNVLKVLQTAQVIEPSTQITSGDGVIGIKRAS